MISKQTVESLNLKNYTLKSCKEMHQELSSKYKSISDLEFVLSQPHSDPEFLNKVWWVLNYHSDIMDNSRKLRALVESRLDHMAN